MKKYNTPFALRYFFHDKPKELLLASVHAPTAASLPGLALVMRRRGPQGQTAQRAERIASAVA